MPQLFQYVWVLFIIGTIINANLLKYRSKKHIDQNPELKKGYQDYFRGMLILGNLPWIIMGIGNLAGLTKNIFEYFNPRQMNPIVLLFHAIIIILWVAGIRWIYFKGGAEFVEKHPGLIQMKGFGESHDITARQLKLFYALALIGGIMAMIMMWSTGMPSQVRS